MTSYKFTSSMNCALAKRLSIIFIAIWLIIPSISREARAQVIGGNNIGVDTGELANVLFEDLKDEISGAIQSQIEQLENQAKDAVYQRVRQEFVDTFGDEITMTQEAINQFLEQSPTINTILTDYREGQSQEVVNSLQGLFEGAQAELNQILELNEQAEDEGDEFQSEYVSELNRLGIRGRWVDKVGEWEGWYQQNAADRVALARQFYEGFEGGAPAGQLTLMFDLIDEYSSNIPILGRFVALYAQVGREMMNAAIRAGALIRRADQGCIGTGTHAGISNWYNLDDPVNTNFGSNFEGELACPTPIDNIFENVDDNSLLYFWTGNMFLVGESGNGGINAIFRIQEFLASQGYASDAESISTLYLVYNQNFSELQTQASTILTRVQTHVTRLNTLRFDCSVEVFELLLDERAGFAFNYAELSIDAPEIRDRILVNRLLNISSSGEENWNSWENLENNLDSFRPVVQVGSVVELTDSGTQPVALAQVSAESSTPVYTGCTELQTDNNGRFQVMFVTNQGSVDVAAYTASVDGRISTRVERFIDPNQPNPNNITLEIDDSDALPVALSITPETVTLDVGESVGFNLLSISGDGTPVNITEDERTSWNTGGPLFTASEAGETIVTASFMGLTSVATVTVLAPQSECEEGFEMNETMGRCINLEEAIEEVAGEDIDALCNEEDLVAQLTRLNEIVARGAAIGSSFQTSLDNFMKVINDQNFSPCVDTIVAVAFSGGLQYRDDLQSMADEATALSTNLILESALCPLDDLEIDVEAIIQRVADLGEAMSRVDQGIAQMESQLLIYGCDEQEVTERGDTIAEQTNDPEVIAATGGGTFSDSPGGGDNPPPSGGDPTDGTFLVVSSIYGGDISAAPHFQLDISAMIGNENVGFNLSQGSQGNRVIQNASADVGDRVTITVRGGGGTVTSGSFTIISRDFILSNGYNTLGIVIAVFYDDGDDDEEPGYRLSIIIGQGPGQNGRVLEY